MYAMSRKRLLRNGTIAFLVIVPCVLLFWAADHCGYMKYHAAETEPIGLVLSGGGAKGAYEVGVWKAFCEAGLDKRIKVMSGTSVGAINAALFAYVGEPMKCVTLWRENIPHIFVLRPKRNDGDGIGTSLLKGLQDLGSATHGPSKSIGKYDSSVLRKELEKIIPNRIVDKFAAVHVTALAKVSGVSKSFLLNEMEKSRAVDCVMASAAIPFFFDSVTIDGVAYVDGGYEQRGGDNIPLRPIAEHTNVKDVFVVYLDCENKLKRRVSSNELRVFEIIPSEDISGLFGFEGTFDVTPEKITNLILLGYNDAKVVIEKYNHVIKNNEGVTGK